MIYLTNDDLDQAVYFDLIRREPRRRRGSSEHLYGVVGNGVSEVTVTVRRWRDCMEMVFGSGEVFRFVEEDLIRRVLGEAVREMVLH